MKDRNMTVKKVCRQCNKLIAMKVNLEDFAAWNQGVYVQKAMPYLSTDERELLISGICGACFDNNFGDEEE